MPVSKASALVPPVPLSPPEPLSEPEPESQPEPEPEADFWLLPLNEGNYTIGIWNLYNNNNLILDEVNEMRSNSNFTFLSPSVIFDGLNDTNKQFILSKYNNDYTNYWGQKLSELIFYYENSYKSYRFNSLGFSESITTKSQEYFNNSSSDSTTTENNLQRNVYILYQYVDNPPVSNNYIYAFTLNLFIYDLDYAETVNSSNQIAINLPDNDSNVDNFYKNIKLWSGIDDFSNNVNLLDELKSYWQIEINNQRYDIDNPEDVNINALETHDFLYMKTYTGFISDHSAFIYSIDF